MLLSLVLISSFSSLPKMTAEILFAYLLTSGNWLPAKMHGWPKSVLLGQYLHVFLINRAFGIPLQQALKGNPWIAEPAENALQPTGWPLPATLYGLLPWKLIRRISPGLAARGPGGCRRSGNHFVKDQFTFVFSFRRRQAHPHHTCLHEQQPCRGRARPAVYCSHSA